ncbi:PREDICTED: glutaredoxin 3 [Ceratosolen solmsi marchali]|uniref:Glutaredoxin 3 n=1 Tax=Ceratosolen solmsi marchali TaxID=326594 RepID=A0AAJ6YFK7_9HYME|nr:PREDICTED: glutaredoxin 3 [Ceratosolen solmsi marchali]
MSIVELISTDEFQNFIKSNDFCVIHFYAPWALQSIQMNILFEQMRKLNNYKNIIFANIIAEWLPEVSIKYNINAVPTILVFKNENFVFRIDGFNPKMFQEQINKQLMKSEYFIDRLKNLINKAPCILFIKGSRKTPCCGFSRAIINLLDQYKTDYETFNILEDDEIREGLKKYSNWPTYPQLYIKGELIGGLDIVKELCESGDLISILPKKIE